jgi:hypothetical protein
VQLGTRMAFTLATHLCGGRCSLSGVMQRTAKHAAKIEPLRSACTPCNISLDAKNSAVYCRIYRAAKDSDAVDLARAYPQVWRSVCGCAFNSRPPAPAARSSIRAKPAVVNGDPRSLTKTNGDVSLSRWSRRRARSPRDHEGAGACAAVYRVLEADHAERVAVLAGEKIANDGLARLQHGRGRDVSEDIAGEVLDRAFDADDNLSEDTKRFIDRYVKDFEVRTLGVKGGRDTEFAPLTSRLLTPS